MTWLLPGTEQAQGPLERRFCRGCAPTGPVADLACVRCGDGPLVAGDLAAGDLAAGDAWAATMLQAWMTSTGWLLDGPVCPDCIGGPAR